MIGKIRKGSGFKGCVDYVLGKQQAVLLHADGVLAESRQDIVRSFLAQADGREDDTTCARVYARDENHRYAVHHRAPPR